MPKKTSNRKNASKRELNDGRGGNSGCRNTKGHSGTKSLPFCCLIGRGLAILTANGFPPPDGTPLIAEHPNENEVLVLVPGKVGAHPLLEIVSGEWDGAFYANCYIPRFQISGYDAGAVMMVRRYQKRPSDVELAVMVVTDWHPDEVRRKFKAFAKEFRTL